MASFNNLDGYHSPAQPPHVPGLPFYQYSQEQQHLHPQQDREEGQQDDGASEGSDGNADASHHAQDDPTLRGQLASMMGNFAGFAPMLQQQQANGSMLPSFPSGSGAYAHAGGSFDADGSLADRNKQGRSKNSRACDECRRKKIRCDAADESGAMPCTSCSRTGVKCAFSRQPMKRGPSKGYIKELAERLNTLERQVHPGQTPQTPHADDHLPPRDSSANTPFQSSEHPEPRTGDKRTYSEALQNESQLRPDASPSPPRIHPDLQAPRQSFSPISHTPQPQSSQHAEAVQPFWRRGGNENRIEATALPYDVNTTPSINISDWNDEVMDEYYRIIHQTFPLLPNNKNRLQQRLQDCPASLRDGFLAALDCTLRSFPTTSLKPNPNYAQALKKAVEMLARYPFDNPSTHNDATNLTYLQTLLLMALEADNHGPATIRGQAGPSRAEWLGRAAGVAGQLEINVIRKSNDSILGGDRDSDARLARRVWWVLFILDRWHASSTADLLKLPENSVVLLPEDQILLGESTYHLARLSFIIGHLAAILTTTKTPSTDVMAPLNPASSLLNLTLAGEIDRFRESVESVWGSLNLVHLSYHHCHLLIKRLSPTTGNDELVGHAVKVATVLNSRLTPVTPLNHHFAALAAMTLCELCDIAKTRVEALKGLEHLAEALGTGRGLAGNQESEGWDGAIRELVKRKIERVQQSSSLDTLADAAGGGEADGERGYDPTLLTRYGYLTALGQGEFRMR